MSTLCVCCNWRFFFFFLLFNLSRFLHISNGAGVHACDIFGITFYSFTFSESIYSPFHCVYTVGDRQFYVLFFFAQQLHTLFTAWKFCRLYTASVLKRNIKKTTHFSNSARTSTNKRERRIRLRTHIRMHFSSFIWFYTYVFRRQSLQRKRKYNTFRLSKCTTHRREVGHIALRRCFTCSQLMGLQRYCNFFFLFFECRINGNIETKSELEMKFF